MYCLLIKEEKTMGIIEQYGHGLVVPKDELTAVERDRLVCGSDCCRSRHERKNQFLQTVSQLLRYESCRVPDAYSGFKTLLAVLI